MQQPQAFWDGVAPKYARKPISDLESYRHTLARARSYLKADDRALELGCGTGSTAINLAPAVKSLTAADLSPAMIEIARQKATADGSANLSFRCAPFFAPELEDGPYDVVLAFNLLHLLTDPGQAVRWVRDLLPPGGLFISKSPCAPDGGAPLTFRMLRLALPLLQWIGKAPYVNLMKPLAWESLIAGQGFTLLESGSHPKRPPNHFIVARKD